MAAAARRAGSAAGARRVAGAAAARAYMFVKPKVINDSLTRLHVNLLKSVPKTLSCKSQSNILIHSIISFYLFRERES